MRALEVLGRHADEAGVKSLRSEEGFGLIELLISMMMLNIGILAIVAAFNSSMFALNRASRISTASALADSQMELYRALTYSAIALDSTALGSVDNTYKCDSALGDDDLHRVAERMHPLAQRHRRRPQAIPGRHLHHDDDADRWAVGEGRDRGGSKRPGALGTAVRPPDVDVRPVDRQLDGYS
jgi:Tfp pilus assembly protein PilE